MDKKHKVSKQAAKSAEKYQVAPGMMTLAGIGQGLDVQAKHPKVAEAIAEREERKEHRNMPRPKGPRISGKFPKLK